MTKKNQKKWGDRKDATWIRESDPMHTLMPYLLLGRTDNEALLNDDVDLTAVNEFLDKKNASDPEFKYTIFHVVLAAIAKTIWQRPAMNRFMQGNRLYQRNDISFSFVVKRKFSDKAEEALVIMKVDPDSEVPVLEQIYSRIKREVYKIRKENVQDDTTDFMALLTKLPRPLLKFVSRLLFWLENRGWLPSEIEKIDPYHSTCFVSNLGSIKMSASYHHLVDWGTNSFFVIIGEKKWKPVFKKDGTYEMKEMLPMGFTIDERIADGFYFANSVKILRYIMKHPEILEQPLAAPVEFEGEF